MVTRQPSLPAQSPLHPTNVPPVTGVADRETAVLSGNPNEQLIVQLTPGGLDTTVPEPTMFTVSTRPPDPKMIALLDRIPWSPRPSVSCMRTWQKMPSSQVKVPATCGADPDGGYGIERPESSQLAESLQSNLQMNAE